MCIAPTFVWQQRGPKWEKQPTPCKICWRCKKNRVDSYVGRALAEAETSNAVCTVTLTYAPRDDLADKLLHPSHFQLFIKRLRRSGHKVRYLVAGEYGDLKGRTHFHAILFFEQLLPRASQYPLYENGIVPAYKADYPEGKTQDDAPFCREIAQMRMVHIREWPHGHIKCDWSATERSIRYVCKYILSDDKNRAWFSISKKPALGAAWFAQKAAQARAHGVVPSTFEYLPPGGTKDRPYLLTGATRRDYLNAITTDPADKSRMSEWVLKTFEKHERARLLDEIESRTPDEKMQDHLDTIAETNRREHEARQWAHLRETADLDDSLAQSCDNTLRFRNGRWSPNIERSEHGSSL